MRADLCFRDSGLEAEFVCQQKARRRRIALQWGTFRCITLLLAAAKALLQVGRQVAL